MQDNFLKTLQIILQTHHFNNCIRRREHFDQNHQKLHQNCKKVFFGGAKSWGEQPNFRVLGGPPSPSPPGVTHSKLLFGCPTGNVCHCLRDCLTHVNHSICLFQPEGHQEPRNKVGPLSPAKHLVGFEPENF